MIALATAVAGFRGVFRIIHPIRKMVRFDDNNHVLMGNEVVLTSHPSDRQRFRIHTIANSTLTLLVNVHNATDYILLHPLVAE